MSWTTCATERLAASGYDVWAPTAPPGIALLADNGNVLVVLIRTEREGDVLRIAHEVRHAARTEGANRLVVALIDPPSADARTRWRATMAIRGADPELLVVDLPEAEDAEALAPLCGLGTFDRFLGAVADNELVGAIDPALARLTVPQPLKGALAADLHLFFEGGQWYSSPPFPQTRAALGLERGPA